MRPKGTAVEFERRRRGAEETPDDDERQLLLGRVYQTVRQLEATRAALGGRRGLVR